MRPPTRRDWKFLPKPGLAAVNNYDARDEAEGPRSAGLGALHIIGTERHGSRRIDNYTSRTCGRQGDPGSSRFSSSRSKTT